MVGVYFPGKASRCFYPSFLPSCSLMSETMCYSDDDDDDDAKQSDVVSVCVHVLVNLGISTGYQSDG